MFVRLVIPRGQKKQNAPPTLRRQQTDREGPWEETARGRDKHKISASDDAAGFPLSLGFRGSLPHRFMPSSAAFKSTTKSGQAMPCPPSLYHADSFLFLPPVHASDAMRAPFCGREGGGRRREMSLVSHKRAFRSFWHPRPDLVLDHPPALAAKDETRGAT